MPGGLTRKQQWRRVLLRTPKRELHSNMDALTNGEIPTCIRTLSEPTLQTKCDLPSRAWATTGDLNNSSQQKIYLKKKLKFDSQVKVILIPTREEYSNIGLGEVLWWSHIDYCSFKESAGLELKAILSVYKIDPKAAIMKLYQPESMCINMNTNEVIDVQKTLLTLIPEESVDSGTSSSESSTKSVDVVKKLSVKCQERTTSKRMPNMTSQSNSRTPLAMMCS